MLDRVAAPRREALAVAQAIDLIDNRRRGVAGQKEIGVQRMRRAALDRPRRGDERLRDHEPAEDALPADLRAAAAIDVFLDLLKIEDGQKIGDGFGHDAAGSCCGGLVAEPLA